MPNFGLHVIDTPTQKFVFVGNVPAILAFVTRDGETPTEEQIEAARQIGPGIVGLVHRSWDTYEEAVQEAARHGYTVEGAVPVRFRYDDGQAKSYDYPGGYPLIYWHQDKDDMIHHGDHADLYPLCGDCVDSFLRDMRYHSAESGSNYDHDIRCDNCGQQLNMYMYEDEAGD